MTGYVRATAFALLGATVMAAWACAPDETSWEPHRSTAHTVAYCRDWMTSSQCDHFFNAMNYLEQVCPEVVWYVTGDNYNVFYDALNDDTFGYSHPDDPYTMYLTHWAFDSYGEMANTIAHEYMHNMGGSEEDANAYGNTCGFNSQY